MSLVRYGFERTMWWVQLAGAGLSIIGCIGMSAYLTQGAASRAGIAFIAAGLLLTLLFGGISALLSIHDWMISLLLPRLLPLFDGIMLLIVGYLRQRCKNCAEGQLFPQPGLNERPGLHLLLLPLRSSG